MGNVYLMTCAKYAKHVASGHPGLVTAAEVAQSRAPNLECRTFLHNSQTPVDPGYSKSLLLRRAVFATASVPEVCCC